MSLVGNCLLLIGLPAVLLLAGYGFANRLTQTSAPERIAVAVLAGLVLLLWNVATVNLIRPLAGVGAWLCLWPVPLPLIVEPWRTALWRDVRTVAGHRRGAAAIALAAGFLLLLLWPLLTRPTLVYYDGTSNHDAFFWIVAAEHLMRHSYMELPRPSELHPLMSEVPAIIGWRPSWGRMGGEGLLALLSSLVGTEAVRVYVAGTAALLAPWIAAVFLIVRTFLSGRLGTVGTFALVALHPVFVFFHGNANLPNLLGALSAAGVIAATERALRNDPDRNVWLVLLMFSLHGLLCSYPEMIPFVALPAGLLWLRRWWAGPWREARRPATAVVVAVLGGLVLNPASFVRAWSGFFESFEAARANESWANLFERLLAAEHVPALATLSLWGTNGMGVDAGELFTFLLLAGLVLALRRATDRVGAGLILAGAGALLIYTVVSGFHYGWQKTVQFGGAAWVAFFPVAILDALAAAPGHRRSIRLASRAALFALAALFLYSTDANCMDAHRWSRRKLLTEDWFTLRAFVREQLPGAPLLVDAASFRMAFFHGMWATYFLPDNPLYFGARGRDNGGYLGGDVRNEGSGPMPPIAGYLVSRDWADSFDANSPRRYLGDTVALLTQANRVMGSSGLQPVNGLPDNASAGVTLDLRPHAASKLVLVLAPRRAENASIRWQVRRICAGHATHAREVDGPAPWRIEVPLIGGELNHLEFTADPMPAPDPLPPFMVKEIRIEDVHADPP